MARLDPVADRAYKRAWARAHPEKRSASDRAWRLANAEQKKAYQRGWRRANSAHCAAAEMARYAAKLRRTPVWADLQKIEMVYEEARWMTSLMGEPWHVDHVVPLRGKEVSGLHVHGNLQILSGVENVRKSNRFIIA